MGSELVSDSSSPDGDGLNKSVPISYTEQFRKHLPYYMAIGMTYDQFYNDDCELVVYFRKAYELKKKIKNEEFWLQGKYIYDAICAVSPILHAFAKTGTKPIPYLKEPYPLTEDDFKKHTANEERTSYNQQITGFQSWVKQANDRMKKKAKEEEVNE